MNRNYKGGEPIRNSKEESIGNSKGKEIGYRDRLARALRLIDDHEERYNQLQDEKLNNKMYIKMSRDGSLGKELAFRLIENKKWEVVADNIKKFKPSDHKEIADFLIEKWCYSELGNNINNFEWLDIKNIVKKVIEKCSSKRDIYLFFWYENSDIRWLDKEIAKLLIEKWYYRIIADNIKSFVELDKDIADLLIKNQDQWKIIYHLDLFEWLDKDIFMSIYDWSIKSLWYVVSGLSSFEWLDTEVAKIIIEEWDENDIAGLASGLISFKWLDKDIGDLLIEEWYIEDVAQNLNSFEELGEEIKNLLIEKWYDLYVEMYPDKF